MIDRTYVGKTKYSYKDLLKKELPEDVNPQHKEVSGEVHLNSHVRKIWLSYFMNFFGFFFSIISPRNSLEKQWSTHVINFIDFRYGNKNNYSNLLDLVTRIARRTLTDYA